MARWRWLAGVAALSLAWSAGILPANADVFGVVIGIDQYGGGDDLQGAVADAQDVAAALRTAGAREVVTLLNEGARRERIFAELVEIEKKVKPGDVIVLHYAGHGSQEPIRPGDPDADGDGLNENFVLGGFLTRHDPVERVIDKEIVAWLADTGRRGVKVLFVADSCHSGGMIRATRPGVRTRQLKIASPGLDAVARSVRNVTLSDPGLDNVTFIAAVPRHRASPEIMIDGKPRGALSWAMARALEGAAAPADTAELTRAQLQRYIVSTVIAVSEGQQVPQMFPARGGDVGVLPLAPGNAAPAKPQVLAQAGQLQGRREIGEVKPLTLAVIGGPAPAMPPPHARLVGADEAPDLVWDLRTHTVNQRIGGVVAENVDTDDIDAVVAKWMTLEIVKRAMGATAPEMELASGLKVYGRGEEVRVRIAEARQPYLTIFNLSPNGRVELLYPDVANADEVKADWRGRPVAQTFFVDRPPFGSEHLVALFSAEPLYRLHAALAEMADRRRAVDLPAELRQTLAQPGIQTGLLPVYTTGR